MSESERVTIQTAPNSARHYNVDNISYLQTLHLEYGLLSRLLFASVIISAVLTGLVLDTLAIVLVGLVVVVGVWLLLKPDDGISIGTLATRDVIQSENPSEIEAEFSEKTPETIQVDGVIDTLLLTLEYRYQFLPENMISVEHTNSLFSLKAFLSLIAGVLLVMLSGVLSENVMVSNATLVAGFGLLFLGGAYPLVKSKTIWAISSTGMGIFRIGTSLLHVLSVGILASAPILELLRVTPDTSDPIAAVTDPAVGFYLPIVMVLTLFAILIQYTLPREGITLSLPNQEQLYFQMVAEDANTVVSEFMDR